MFIILSYISHINIILSYSNIIYTDNKDAIIATLIEETRALRATVTKLEEQVDHDKNASFQYYSSNLVTTYEPHRESYIPDRGLPAKFVAERIENAHLCDFNPRLNTSSYVNVVSEEEERKVALMGSEVNIADASVYPASINLHNRTVNMIANMWHCLPAPNATDDYAGAGTVGSTEACLLAGLALKFRWRKWYQARHGLSDTEILGMYLYDGVLLFKHINLMLMLTSLSIQAVRPNLVMSSGYQAAW